MKKLLFIFSTAALMTAFQSANAQHLVWAKQFGGTSPDAGQSIAVDAAGNIYTTGSFEGTADFDPGPGIFNLTSVQPLYEDIFITKLDAFGNLVWAKQLGAYWDDAGQSIAVDAAGNVYATGYFYGTADFDPGTGVFNLTSSIKDVFIIKLDASGNLVWAKQLGGYDYDYASSIAIDDSGNVYTTGWFSGTADFDPGPATFNLTATGAEDIFITKLDASGNLIWAKQLGGSFSNEEGRSIAVDTAGNVYATGFFDGTVDFDPGPATFNLNSGGGGIFIIKLDASGNLIWAKQLGSGSNDIGYFLTLDAAGNVYATGVFQFTADFDPGPATFNLNAAGVDIFITKLNASGNLVWVKQLGGTDNDYGYSIAVDSTGSVYTTGYFLSTGDFDPGPATFNLTHNGLH